MDGRTHGQSNGRTVGLSDGATDGRDIGSTNGHTVGWTDAQTYEARTQGQSYERTVARSSSVDRSDGRETRERSDGPTSGHTIERAH